MQEFFQISCESALESYLINKMAKDLDDGFVFLMQNPSDPNHFLEDGTGMQFIIKRLPDDAEKFDYEYPVWGGKFKIEKL